MRLIPAVAAHTVPNQDFSPHSRFLQGPRFLAFGSGSSAISSSEADASGENFKLTHY